MICCFFKINLLLHLYLITSKILSHLSFVISITNLSEIYEKHDRKYNLLFYGFPEERSEHIFDKFRKVFVNDLGIDPYTVDNMYFVHGHRLPTENEEGPKPAMLRFAHYGDRDIVLSNAYKLAGT